MNREVYPTPILPPADEDSPANPPGLLPIGAFPLLESMWPADTGDKEKARVIVGLLALGLHSDSDLEVVNANAQPCDARQTPQRRDFQAPSSVLAQNRHELDEQMFAFENACLYNFR